MGLGAFLADYSLTRVQKQWSDLGIKNFWVTKKIMHLSLSEQSFSQHTFGIKLGPNIISTGPRKYWGGKMEWTNLQAMGP